MKFFKLYKRPVATLLAFALLLSSCSHKVWRDAYASPQSVNPDCSVSIKKGVDMSTIEARHLGEVRLGDTGFSTRCSELEARNILRQEACSVGANLVNITMEQRPDLMSTCYRCSASMYYIDADSLQNSQSELLVKADPEAPLEAGKSNTGMQILGYIAGFTIGYLIGYYIIGPMLFD